MRRKYERHPLSAAWPDMGPDEFQALCDSIENSGLREPIVLLDKQILDGWHRYQACLRVDMDASFVAFDGADPVEFISDKHNRRSLNLTQRMTAIALMHQWAPRGGAGNKSECALSAHSTGAGNKSECALSAHSTAADMAKQAGGSVRTAVQVKTAIAKGDESVVSAMKGGEISARRAAEIAQLPKDQQAAAIKGPTPKKAKPEPHPTPEAFGPDADELAANEAATRADMDALQKLLDSDDKLATAHAEIKRLNAELAVVKVARDGYMNQCNELIRKVKSLQRKLDQAAA